MRTLIFRVDRQRLLKDRNCDFSMIVAGSVNYLKAKFIFSPEWDRCIKAVSFWVGDREYAVCLDKNNECFVHEAVSNEKVFEISVTGLRPDTGYKIKTTKCKITQEV